MAAFSCLEPIGCEGLWRDVIAENKTLSKLLDGCGFRCETAEAQVLCKDLHSLTEWYRHHQPEDAQPTKSERRELKRLTLSLEDEIESTAWHEVKRRKKLLQDFYTQIVPSYLDLIGSAITALPNAWTAVAKLSDMQEMHQILRLFIEIHKRIYSLDTKFVYDVAIKRPTRNVFHPRCREMERKFRKEMTRQESLQKKSTERLRAEAIKRKEAFEASEQAERARIAKKRHLIREEYYERLKAKDGRRQSMSAEPQRSTASKTGWTYEQDDALIVHLSVNGQLPGK